MATKVRAIKYRSRTKHRDPAAAQAQVEDLQDKHPKDEFAILVNMRAYNKPYTVAQVEHVEVDWPSDDEIGAPPEPKRPGGYFGSANYDQQAWDDYRHEAQKRDAIIAKALDPIKKRLTGPFGS